MQYAIKTIKKNMFNKHSVACITREVEFLRNLDHPNIVKYFETYEDELYLNIVMEYIPGNNLWKLITNKGYTDYTESDIMQISLMILKTVQFLHSNQIVHRDLKPENIWFSWKDKYESLKIIDFGWSIGKAEKDNSRVGSPYYMSPEMVNGNFSYESDIWSIGVILFFMVTGKQAFQGKNKNIIFEKITRGKYDTVLWNKSHCSNELKDLIKKIWIVDVNKRITLPDILTHPWWDRTQQERNMMKIEPAILDSLREFEHKNLLQKEILFIMAKISSESEIQKLKEAFIIIDSDNSGEIEFCEWPAIFEKLQIKASNKELKSIWNSMDFHQDGKINYSEFLAATLSAVKFSKEEKLWSVFQYFDTNDTGYITADSVIEALKSNNWQVNSNEWIEVFKQLKSTGHTISFDEFKQIFFHANGKTASLDSKK